MPTRRSTDGRGNAIMTHGGRDKANRGHARRHRTQQRRPKAEYQGKYHIFDCRDSENNTSRGGIIPPAKIMQCNHAPSGGIIPPIKNTSNGGIIPPNKNTSSGGIIPPTDNIKYNNVSRGGMKPTRILHDGITPSVNNKKCKTTQDGLHDDNDDMNTRCKTTQDGLHDKTTNTYVNMNHA